jgi:hypothetical protein
MFIGKRQGYTKFSCETVPSGNGVSAEAEESPLLGAVTRKQLVKTLQAAENLVSAAVICKV